MDRCTSTSTHGVGPRLIEEDIIDASMLSIDRAQVYWPVSSCALTAAESRNAAARSAPTAWRRWHRARTTSMLFLDKI